MKPYANRAGFTLLELLVATAVSLVLATLLIGIVSRSLDAWQRTRSNADTSAAACQVLDYLERDLQAASWRRDGGAWLAVDVSATTTEAGNHAWLLQAGMKPAVEESRRMLPVSSDGTIASCRFGLGGCWLRFVGSNWEGNDAPSTPAVIAYQIARRPVTGTVSAANPAEVRYRLYRTAVTPSLTFANGYGVKAAAYAVASASPAAARTAAAVSAPNNQEALADNVVDFGLWLHAREPDGRLRRLFPLTGTSLSYTAPVAGEFPVVADLMLRILTPVGAMRLAQIEQGRVQRPAEHATEAAWWWAEVEAHSQVFTRRVVMPGGAL